jgi:hypothetical protein
MSKIFVKIGAKKYDTEDYETPTERVFRNAWAANESEQIIFVDMEKAREVWRNKIRAAREAEFVKLDAAYIRALETNADTSDIIARKQELRDAPADPAIDLATTPEELKLVKPGGLDIE